MTKEELIAFEEDIANEFNAGKIRAPVHLQSNCFDQLISIFRYVGSEDWVLGTWRFHTEALLKGVSPFRLKSDILRGKSISLCYPEYKVFCSAVVGGILSIGVGLGLAIKRIKKNERVWVFCGEMTAMTGAFHECLTYSRSHELPITFVVADNGKSVCTNTRAVWNLEKLVYEPDSSEDEVIFGKNLCYYKYNLSWPHAGAGQRVQF